ncbi:MAG: DUF58 domain-containing protein [Clostridiaceae bacterium]
MKQSRILYICLFIMALIFAYFNGGKIPYMLLYTAILLPLVSLIYTIIIYIRFKFGQELDKKFVTKGDKVHFIFSVNNEDFFIYPYISVTFHGAKTIFENQVQICNFSLRPYSGINHSFELQCNYRGSYEIGIHSVEIEDFFGLFKFKYNINEPKYVTVYPRIIYLENFLLKTDFMSESHSILNNRTEDMTTTSDVRKYAYGDSLKRIHWKLTAKTRSFMVKKFQSTSEVNTLILLDLQKNPYSGSENIILEDKVIESIVAVLYYCLYNWIPINLVYFNGKLNSIEAKNHLLFNELFELMANIKFSGTVPIKDLLEIYVNNEINKTNIVIFTSNLDYDLYNQIYRASNSGFDVSMVYTSPEKITGKKITDAENILSFLPEIGVNSYKIDIDDNIKEVLER